MQIALAAQSNLEIRAANVKDLVLSSPDDPLGRRVVGLRIGTSLLPRIPLKGVLLNSMQLLYPQTLVN